MEIRISFILTLCVTLCFQQAQLNPVSGRRDNEEIDLSQKIRNLTAMFDDITLEFKQFLKLMPPPLEPVPKTQLKNLCFHSGIYMNKTSEKLKRIEDALLCKFADGKTLLDHISKYIAENSTEICIADYLYDLHDKVFRTLWKGDIILRFSNHWLSFKNYNISECNSEIGGTRDQAMEIGETTDDRVIAYRMEFSRIKNQTIHMKSEACDENHDPAKDIEAIGTQDLAGEILAQVMMMRPDLGVHFFVNTIIVE